jgi:hypothetical protein
MALMRRSFLKTGLWAGAFGALGPTLNRSLKIQALVALMKVSHFHYGIDCRDFPARNSGAGVSHSRPLVG